MASDRRISQLDAEIRKISASTRTSIVAFSPLHNWLRAKSKLYYNWHTNKYASFVHLVVLVMSLFIVGTLAVAFVGGGLVLGLVYYLR